MERFFDASGGMQLVIHSPFGSRLNRAWGLALRKRFCRTFNFELQAAATEDAIVLSLSTSHSFALDEVGATCTRPRRCTCWCRRCSTRRCSACAGAGTPTTALALPRFSGGRKVAPQLQRMRSEDLLAGRVPRPGGLRGKHRRRARRARASAGRADAGRLPARRDGRRWLAGAAAPHGAGEVRMLARDLPAPSPLAMEILSARPYAFLDDAPLEERRTQAVQNRRYTDPAERRRRRPARRGRHCQRARRSLAAAAQCRRDARGADEPGLPTTK
jgi:ATP-dependent Lhr-like helicase